jgi:ABC-type nickel/cobalt efflux system permease component RcnA
MKARRALLALLAAIGLSVVVAVPAFAHPLGNFTINRFSQVQVDGDRIDVLYVIDYAEIPAFQEKQRIADDPAYLDRQVRQIGGGLVLDVGGQRVPLKITDHSVAFLPGQGGLQTMRLQIVLSAVAPAHGRQSATYRDTNYQGRLGWKEVVVQQAGGAALLTSSAPAQSVTNALRVYPQDMLASPLDVTEARFTFVPSVAASARTQPVLTPIAPGPLRFVTDRFAALITPSRLTPSVLAWSLLAALLLGALHALTPGHGKAVMAGYLVGARGTARHALELGVTITATHTAGVFLLGLVTLYAAAIVTPERLYPWVTLLSGLAIVGIGGSLLLARARTAWHGHDHGHEHAHEPIGRRGRIALGISSGIVPCPSALVVLLAAVSLHRVLFGVLLIVAFSVGLAAVLTGIGLVLAGGLPLLVRLRAVGGRHVVARSMRLVPVVSALVVTVAGLGLTVQAIPGVR